MAGMYRRKGIISRQLLALLVHKYFFYNSQAFGHVLIKTSFKAICTVFKINLLLLGITPTKLGNSSSGYVTRSKIFGLTCKQSLRDYEATERPPSVCGYVT